MGKKGSWFCTVKKALSLQSNKDEKTQKSKKKSGKIPEEAENEETKHPDSVSLATTTMVAEAAVEGGRRTSASRYLGKSTEEIAAVRIQIVFRGYLARKAFRALKRMMRLRSLIQGQSISQQATKTLKCMGTLARVQSQTRKMRIIMSEQNRALQKHLQHKHEKELQKSKSMGEDFNVSTQTKEQIEAKQQHRKIAAMRRGRALAYSFTHQRSWKNPLKPVNQIVTDSNHSQWSWSWLERWMAARPWDNNDRDTIKSVRVLSNDHNKRSSTQPSSHRSSSTPPSKTLSFPSVSRKTRFSSPNLTRGHLSDRYKRHSTGGLSVRDDEMFASSPSVPSNKMSTKGRSRLPSNETSERGLASSAKKRYSAPSKVDI